MPDPNIFSEVGAPADDDAVEFGEGAITLWANMSTLMTTHPCDRGMPQGKILDMLTMLHDTNEATIRSPRAKASAATRTLKMARSAHSYVRGNTKKFYEWPAASPVAAHLLIGSPIGICGDCHRLVLTVGHARHQAQPR